MKKAVSFALAFCLLLCAPVLAASGGEVYRGETFAVKTDGNGSKYAAIKENGDLYLWGFNGWGTVGNGTKEYQATPVKILSNVVSVDISSFGLSAALTESGDLYLWGNYYTDDYETENDIEPDKQQLRPVKVLGGVRAYAVSGKLCAAITENGDLYTMGADSGWISNGSALASQGTPRKLLSNIESISFDPFVALAIAKDGTRYIWGLIDMRDKDDHAFSADVPIEKVKNGDGKMCYILNSPEIDDGSVDYHAYGSLSLAKDGTLYYYCGAAKIKVFDDVKSYLTMNRFNIGSHHFITKSGDLYSYEIDEDGLEVKSKKLRGGIKDFIGYESGRNWNGAYGLGRIWYGVLAENGDTYYSSGAKGDQLTLSNVLYAMPYAAITADGGLYVIRNGKATKILDGVACGSDIEGTNDGAFLTKDGTLYQLKNMNQTNQKYELVKLMGGVALPGSPAPAAPPADAPKVQLSTQKLSVDGALRATEIYNINGANYFKLRDMAALLNGTGSQFSVGYDNATKTISVTVGEAYTSNGSELKTGVDKSATAKLSTQSILIDGKSANLTAYNIGGNNFFKLKELGDALGFGVDYDAATRTMLVTSH